MNLVIHCLLERTKVCLVAVEVVSWCVRVEGADAIEAHYGGRVVYLQPAV